MNKNFKQYNLYILFAILSIIINIGTQKISEIIINCIKFDLFFIYIYKNIDIALLFKMGVATIIAFLFKFFADKIVIFQDKEKSIKNNLKKIFLYGFFAIFTTLIFWGTELFFKLFFKTNFSEITGAIIGLIIGYTIKFLLDKKYVFNIKNIEK